MICADTITVTTECSGGCQHCPFSHSEIEKLNLQLEPLTALIAKSRAPLLVLSGGEFFEYLHLESLMRYLAKSEKKFRIATGGHISLKPFLSRLKKCVNLEGISFGTDIIFRQNQLSRMEIWYQNINLLYKMRIPYSITFTFLEGVIIDFQKKVRQLKEVVQQPQFVYLRLGENADESYIEFIKNSFADITIIEDRLFRE